MKVILCLALLTCLIFRTEGKKYNRCELYKMFKNTGLAGYHGHSAADWICVAKHESDYTSTKKTNHGTSQDYGIFQINSKHWCKDEKPAGSPNGCKMRCKNLLDENIHDDIECAKKVIEGPSGISAWPSWEKYCKGKDLSKYTKGC
ncbi:hypothetical protein FKM82_015976 [Ascaphus truei]|uniref:lysozyme C-like n=1 Tax=Ascaphus truei TaxID=8439 RepID=UPI003F5A0CF6